MKLKKGVEASLRHNSVVLEVIFFLYQHLLRGVADFDTQDTLIRPFESTPTDFELAYTLLTKT